MTNASKAKGDQFEWDTRTLANDPDGRLAEVGLTVERTKAGYERDEGDLLVLTPDRQRLATLQLKNRRERKWSEWLAATETQGRTARARFAALIVKRNGIADVGRSYVISTVHAYLDLLATLYEADRRARVAEETLTALREQGIKIPTLRPVEIGPATLTMVPESDVPDAPAPAPRVRPFGPHGLVGSPQ
jgi:hypothetical protein